MTHTLDFAALPGWLDRETRMPGGGVAVLAGHFAIFSAGAAATDLLDEPERTPDGATGMLDFTRMTWKLACGVLGAPSSAPAQCAVLVDDIQFVRPVTQDRAVAERLAASLASAYLERVPELPGWHARELAAHGMGVAHIVCHSEDRWLFSERELRHQAVIRVRRHLARGGGQGVRLSASDNGSTMTVTVPEYGDYCLVQSGHTTCAGGYVELLARLHDRGIRKLISFVPMRCMGQVSLGSALAQGLFSLDGFEVVNVAVPDPAVSNSVIVDHAGTAARRVAY